MPQTIFIYVGTLGYIVGNEPKAHSPELWCIAPETPCVFIYIPQIQKLVSLTIGCVIVNNTQKSKIFNFHSKNTKHTDKCSL